MRSLMRVIMVAGVGVTLGLSACGSDPDPGSVVVTSAKATAPGRASSSATTVTKAMATVPTSERDVGDGDAALEAVIPFFLLGCTCATDALVAGFGAEGFVDLLGSTDGPTPADDATTVAAFDSCGIGGTAIVGG